MADHSEIDVLTPSFLKQLRTLAGISTSEAASKVGVNRATWWRWEQGGTIPIERESAIRAIASELQIQDDSQKQSAQSHLGLVSISNDYLQTRLLIDPTRASALIVEEDAMDPTIRMGELAILERIEPGEPIRDGIHLIQVGSDSGLVRRLARRPGGMIAVLSDHPSYPAFEL